MKSNMSKAAYKLYNNQHTTSKLGNIYLIFLSQPKECTILKYVYNIRIPKTFTIKNR